MPPYAKAVIASLIVVAHIGLIAWQTATGDGFQWTDLFPLTASIGGAVLTYTVPNVPQLPWAKAAVSGVLQAVAAVAVLYEDGPVGVNLTTVLIALLGTFAVYQVPNKPAPVPPAASPLVN